MEDRRQGEKAATQADPAHETSAEPAKDSGAEPAGDAQAELAASAQGEAEAAPAEAEAAATEAALAEATPVDGAPAEATPADGAPAEAAQSAPTEPARRSAPAAGGDRHEGGSGGGESRADRSIPLRKLVELAARYAEVGPPLAELCFAIGESETAEQLVRLGTQGGAGGGVEYWFVAANAARRQRRYSDALRATIEAVQAFAAAPDQSLGAEGESRFLHLIRLGFATLMFDLRDLNAEPEFGRALAEGLPRLEGRLGTNAFFRSLVAQTLWFTDKEASEREWDRADDLGDPETTWNARGTWYNEAEHDLDKAERAYRRGLEKVQTSALLMHNLAQILVEKAKKPGVVADEARRRLNQATELLRSALRQDAPRLRRHIHATRDRLEELRRTLPPAPARSDRDRGPRDRDRFARDRGPGPGDRATGGGYGGGGGGGGYGGGGGGGGGGGHDRGHGGGHQQAGDRDRDRAPVAARPPAAARPSGDRPGGDRDRGPSGDRPSGDRGPRRPPRESQPQQPRQKFLVDGTVSLGEMILAKLKEQQEKG